MGSIAWAVKPYTWPSKLSSTQTADKIDSKIRSLPITSNLERHLEISKTRRTEKTKLSCIFSRTPLLIAPSSPTQNKQVSCFPISTTKLHQFETRIEHAKPLFITLNRRKAFGSSGKKSKKFKKPMKTYVEDVDDADDDEEVEELDRGEGVIPEIVTNRMISRMGFSVGIPLFTGLLFFPFFYYLKVGLKLNVPQWVPFIVSFFFFGSAILGVSYGIVSSSWDPMREGSLLGWTEAQKNWPVFWQSFWGDRSQKN